MTHYDICLQTIPGRDIRRPQPTREQRIRKLEQYLAECGAWGSHTTTYKNAEEELKTLKAEG